MTVPRFFPLMLLLLLMTGLSVVTAQEDDPSLRSLADANDFYVGAAAYTTHLDNPVHAEVLGSEFNMLTPEQEAKFCELQQTRGVFNFTYLDRLMDFAEENDMVVRGHALVWHACSPDWLENGDFSREEAISILRNHIYTVVGRYKGRIPMWDVVNEAIDGTSMRDVVWMDLIGEEYVDMAFQFAHEADPDALLFYNDYGGEGLGGKADAIYEMVTGMVERGVPIHGVGLQMHIQAGVTRQGSYLTSSIIDQNITRLGELGLDVHITEMDVNHDGEATEEILELQAGDYYRVLQTCLENEACTAFIVWGVTDQFTWLRDPEWGSNPVSEPLLFDDDYQPKPAYFAVLDVLARAAGMEPILSDEEIADYVPVEAEPQEEAELPEPSFSDADQLAPDSVDGVAYYAPFPVAIELDGELADWDGVPRVAMGDASESAETESLTFAAAADDENLYFMADIRDPHIIYGFNEPAGGWYLEDSVEFYLNTTDDLFATAYSTGVAQIGIMAANLEGGEEAIFGGSNSTDSDVSVAVVETEEGYRVEASVPLTNDAWTITPEHLARIGFQVHLNGASSPEESQSTKLIWSAADTEDQSWTNPGVFGRLIFWNVDQ